MLVYVMVWNIFCCVNCRIVSLLKLGHGVVHSCLPLLLELLDLCRIEAASCLLLIGYPAEYFESVLISSIPRYIRRIKAAEIPYWIVHSLKHRPLMVSDALVIALLARKEELIGYTCPVLLH